MTYSNSIVHQLINKERKKQGLSYVRWSQKLYYLAKGQASICAREHHLVHSSRYALQGGENLCEGNKNMSPRQIVNCWMDSREHCEWLFDPRVKFAGVGIIESGHKVYVAWTFSE